MCERLCILRRRFSLCCGCSWQNPSPRMCCVGIHTRCRRRASVFSLSRTATRNALPQCTLSSFCTSHMNSSHIVCQNTVQIRLKLYLWPKSTFTYGWIFLQNATLRSYFPIHLYSIWQISTEHMDTLKTNVPSDWTIDLILSPQRHYNKTTKTTKHATRNRHTNTGERCHVWEIMVVSWSVIAVSTRAMTVANGRNIVQLITVTRTSVHTDSLNSLHVDRPTRLNETCLSQSKSNAAIGNLVSFTIPSAHTARDCPIGYTVAITVQYSHLRDTDQLMESPDAILPNFWYKSCRVETPTHGQRWPPRIPLGMSVKIHIVSYYRRAQQTRPHLPTPPWPDSLSLYILPHTKKTQLRAPRAVHFQEFTFDVESIPTKEDLRKTACNHECVACTSHGLSKHIGEIQTNRQRHVLVIIALPVMHVNNRHNRNRRTTLPSNTKSSY